jgi:hypothetical protein
MKIFGPSTTKNLSFSSKNMKRSFTLETSRKHVFIEIGDMKIFGRAKVPQSPASVAADARPTALDQDVAGRFFSASRPLSRPMPVPRLLTIKWPEDSSQLSVEW